MGQVFCKPELADHSLHKATIHDLGKRYRVTGDPQPCHMGEQGIDSPPQLPMLVRLWPQPLGPPLPKEGLSHLWGLPLWFCQDASEKPKVIWQMVSRGQPQVFWSHVLAQGLGSTLVHLDIWPQSNSAAGTFPRVPSPLPMEALIPTTFWNAVSLVPSCFLAETSLSHG